MSVTPSRTSPSYNNDRNYLPDLPDQLRVYDEAVCAWLARMRFDYGAREEQPNIQPLRVIKASPERAFADLMVDKPFSEDVTEYEVAQEQLPLPLASFTRSDLIVDMTRFKSVVDRKVDYLRRCKDEVYQYRYPLPYNITYQVDFWTRYESTMDAIRVWTVLQFPHGNYFYMPVDMTSIHRLYKVQKVFTQFGGITDTSDLEPGTEQRVIRSTMTLDVQGWIFFPVEIAKTVLSGQIDVLVIPSEIPLQESDGSAKINEDVCCNDAYDEFIADEIPFSSQEEN